MICSLVTLFNLNIITKLALMSIGICIEVYMCSGWFFKQSINCPTGISPLHILWTAVNMGNLQRDEIMNYPLTLMAVSNWQDAVGLRWFICSIVQCSPFITHLITHICKKNMVMLWRPNFYHGILQRNYRKMTMKWSFSYYSFIKLSLYLHNSLITQTIPRTPNIVL